MRRRTSFVCLLTAGLGLAVLDWRPAAGRGPSPVPSPRPCSGSAVLQGTVDGRERRAACGRDRDRGLGHRGRRRRSSCCRRCPPAPRTCASRAPGSTRRCRCRRPAGRAGDLDQRRCLSGSTAQITTPSSCTPTADTFFSGLVEQVSGTRLVVARADRRHEPGRQGLARRAAHPALGPAGRGEGEGLGHAARRRRGASPRRSRRSRAAPARAARPG